MKVETAVTGAAERSTLFTALAERLLAGEANDQPERRAHLLRLLGELLPAVSGEVRSALVADLLALPDPPRDLALLMARDDPEISGPLLREGVFSTGELCELVMRTGPAHHVEIARRADLTLDVWLALARAATRRAAGERDAATTPAAHPGPASSSQTVTRPLRGRGVPRDEAPEGPAESGGEVLPSGPAAVSPLSPSPSMPTDKAGDAGPAANLRPLAGGPPVTRHEPGRITSVPLEDPGPDAWAFRTDRTLCLTAISPAAVQAFGRSAAALVGESFPHLLQLHAAAPGDDEIGPAMRARRPIRDLVVELTAGEAWPARRWRIRARPRFSFPEGRFLGYEGTARDLDRLTRRTREASPTEVLDRMVLAAERLATRVDDPALEDYARSLADLARSLKQAVLSEGTGSGALGRWPLSDLDGENEN